ncbi:hypothetical protein [Nocardia sp. NPDC019255]|uniref:hypothetical protein n=1 Tax=Nocardia sp. NPDC019255 TaxID=3154591 RepID=UPI00340E61F3
MTPALPQLSTPLTPVSTFAHSQTSRFCPTSRSRRWPLRPDIDGQTDINNALSQAANEFMLAATVGAMVGGIV